MSDNIPVPTLKLLLKELKKVEKWFELGVYLDVPVDQLKKIESSYHQRDLERCKIDMLQYWLDNDVNVSWKNLAQALKQIDQHVLAETVKQQYLCGDEEEGRSQPAVDLITASSTQPSASSTPHQSNTSPPLSPVTTEGFEPEIKAGADVVQELRNLQRFLSDTIVDVKDFLQRNCDLSNARLFLNSLNGTKDFSRCKNFDELLLLLQEQEYIDTFNIIGLQDLVAHFNRDELTQLVKNYDEKKETFLKNTTVLSFQEAVVSTVQPIPPRGKVTLTIKISKKLANKRTLKDIKELAMEGFKECYRSLVRLHVKAGSIIILWVFPEALIGRLEQLIRENAAVFKNAEVEEVSIDGRRVYPVTDQEKLPTHLQDIHVKEEESTVKQVYTEFYDQLVDAVSDPHTCQSLAAQLHSTISQEKITQLKSGQPSGSEFLKVLGVEEEPHLLTVFMEKMAGMKQLQTLAEQMTARLSELQVVTDSEKYSSDFEDIQEKFSQLFGEVTGILEKEKSVTLNKLKRLLFKYPELKTSLDNTSTISDAIILLQEHSSITCCSYLKHVATRFNIPAAIVKIESYYKCVEEFCQKKLTHHIYMKPFIIGKSVTFTPSTTITFKLQWSPAEKTLSDVQSILRVAFRDHSTDVHIVMVREGTVRVLCYSPQHVMKRLVKLAQMNKEELVGSGVAYLRVGVTIVVDNIGQSEMALVEALVLQLNSALQLKDFHHILISKDDSQAEDVTRKSDVPHSSDVSEGTTGVVHSGSWRKPTTKSKSKEVGPIISQNQAEHLLYGKPKGTFLVRELDGSASDPSLTAVNTHEISVVVKGKLILHFGIYKEGEFYVTLNNEKFSSIKQMIRYYSRIGFLTGEGIHVKLTNQLIPDEDTLARLPSDAPPIIQYYSFQDVASLPKHFPHHDERTWLCPQLSSTESLRLLRDRKDETFLVRATELSEPAHVYTLDVMVKRRLKYMYIFKRGAWLQLESMDIRYDCINTLVMESAISTIPLTVDGQVVLTNLRYPVHAALYYQQRSSRKV